jgi:N-methylhydantoinase A
MLGNLDAGFFLGGEMRIERGLAEAAIGALAGALGVAPSRAALGVHDIVNENMAGAARVAVAERGRAPQDYALLATGGAGPVHAWAVARRLGIGRVACPPGAGAGSTFGMLMAPARADRVGSYAVPLGRAEPVAMRAILDALENSAREVLGGSGADLAAATVRRLADMRYAGQGSEISVTLPDDLLPEAVRAGFEAAYCRLFGRTPPGAAIEFVALRLSLSAPMPGGGGALDLMRRAEGPKRKGVRPVFHAEAADWVETAVYDRYALAPGERITGPAVFEEAESTFVIGPGSVATVLPDGTILAEVSA